MEIKGDALVGACRVCGIRMILFTEVRCHQVSVSPPEPELRYERPDVRERHVLVLPPLAWWERVALWWQELRTSAGW